MTEKRKKVELKSQRHVTSTTDDGKKKNRSFGFGYADLQILCELEKRNCRQSVCIKCVYNNRHHTPLIKISRSFSLYAFCIDIHKYIVC